MNILPPQVLLVLKTNQMSDTNKLWPGEFKEFLNGSFHLDWWRRFISCTILHLLSVEAYLLMLDKIKTADDSEDGGVSRSLTVDPLDLLRAV